VTVNLLQLSGFARPLLTQCPSPLLTAARQQRQRGAKMINNDWQARIWLLDTREIVRIVASNTARIDLPMWLRSEPYSCCSCSNSLSVVLLGMNLWRAKYHPFMHSAQTQFCRRLIVVPLTTFHRLSELIGDPQGELIFVFHTARCGSTLLTQVRQW